MNFIDRNLKYFAVLGVTAVIGILSVAALGQEAPLAPQGPPAQIKNKEHKSYNRSFCSSNNWSDDSRVAFREVREFTVPAGGTIEVDAGQNGGISVKGEDRSDVQVRACVQTWGTSAEAAKAAASNIRISTSGQIMADGASEKNWSVSYQLLVPSRSNIDLKAHNGGISISNLDGKMNFETRNGGLHLESLAGDVKGITTNGGIHVTLTGATWSGTGLDLQTTNGGVKIAMPENYAANIETGTVNGGLRSSIPALNFTAEDKRGDHYNRKQRINTSIHGGGSPIRIMTTNGGINIGVVGD